MKRRREASLAPRIAATLLGSIVAIGLCEAIARLLLPWPPPSMIRFNELYVVAEGAGFGPHVDNLFEPDPEVFWRLRPNSFLRPGGPMFGTIANSQGLRELREIDAVKPERQIRILFLGDSTTFGWDLPADETQAHLTEVALLSERVQPGLLNPSYWIQRPRLYSSLPISAYFEGIMLRW